jgi:hypothetical protein
MVKTKINKLKAQLISGVLALSAVAAPFTASVTPSVAVTANAADTDNYARLLQYSLYFYDANMCGDNSTGAISWRSNCHMTDEVKGGFHDAGDHAMFGLPQGFTASTLEWSYYEFGDAFDATGQTEHLKVILDHFCEFFKNSTKLSGGTVTDFLYMKGEGHEDHNYWGPPEQQGSRQMFWTSQGQTKASDIAAEYAAALAANYKNFGQAEDLTYAKALYNFSTQYNQPFSCEFYGSNSVADDQAWAAGWLYLATGDSQYLNDLKSKLPKVGWVHGWNDAHLGAACLLGEITNDWSAANGFMSANANGSNYMFLDKWGSARLNCSMQFTTLVATAHQAGNYKDWAKGQMNYILGQNPANTCFVTGFASNSAKNAHHRAASGYTSYEQFPTGEFDQNDHMKVYSTYGSNSHTLIGALVGGPCDAGGTYHDNMSDYVCNEVAIDYNAGLVGAAAGLYHFYGTGSCDTSIEGVTKIYSGSSQPTTSTTTQQTTTTTQGGNSQTTTTTTRQQSNTTTTTKASTNGNTYEVTPNKHVVFDQNADEKMIAFPWEDFGLPSGAKVKKVEVTISSNSDIGKWEGAFGSSTSVAPDYWTMTDNMSQSISGKTGTITWNVDSDTAAIIQTQYGGELKFGTWWINSGEFTVDSVKVTVDGGTTTTTTTKATTTTTSTTTTRTTTTTTTTTKATTTTTQGGDGNYLAGDANCNGVVNMADAVAIMKSQADPDNFALSTQGRKNADVVGNDGVTNEDALAIQKYEAGIYTKLPV